MTMPPASVTIPASMSTPAAMDAVPSAPAAVDALAAQLDEQMTAAEERAWAEAPAEAQAQHARETTAAAQSLRGPRDEVEAWLSDVEDAGRIGAEAQASIEAEELAGTAGDSDLDDDDDDEVGDQPITVSDAAAAQEIAATAEAAELKYLRTLDTQVMGQLQQLTGDVTESNGKSRFDNLADRSVRGQLSKDEQLEFAEQNALRTLAAPVAHVAQRITIDKLGNTLWSGIQAAVRAGASADQATAVFGAGFAEIGRLAMLGRQAELAHSKPATRSTSPQTSARSTTPSTKSNATRSTRAAATPPSGVRMRMPEGLEVEPGGAPSESFMAKALNPDGTLRDDFDALAKAGRFLGVDLSKM